MEVNIRTGDLEIQAEENQSSISGKLQAHS